jgi:hypothetical protein
MTGTIEYQKNSGKDVYEHFLPDFLCFKMVIIKSGESIILKEKMCLCLSTFK